MADQDSQALTLADLIAVRGVGSLLASHLPVLDRVRLRGLSHGFRAAVDESWTLLTRLSGDDLAGVGCQRTWLQGLLWVLPRCPNLVSFVAGGAEYMPWKEGKYRQYASIEDIEEATNRVLQLISNWQHGQRLRELDLEGCCESTAVVTSDRISTLARNLPNLRRLNLTNCTLVTDISMKALARHCPQLRHVQLRRTWVTDVGVVAIVQGCRRLLSLDVTSLNVTNDGMQAIARNCRHLSRLKVSWTMVTFAGLCAVLRSCPRLRSLECVNGKIGDAMGAGALIPELSPSLPSSASPNGQWELRHLNLDFFDGLSDTALEAVLRHCPDLRTLVLSRNPGVRDASMIAQHCPQLRHLDLAETGVTGAGISDVARCCDQLRQLDVGCCEGVTGESIEAVATHCPRLLRLTVGGHIGGATLRAVVARCRGLRALSVLGAPTGPGTTGPGTTGPGTSINLLGEFWRLRELTICHDRLPDATTAGFLETSSEDVEGSSMCVGRAGCEPRLENLTLRGRTAITKAGFAALVPHLARLQVLIMVGPCGAATDAGITAVAASCPRLQCLDLVDCHDVTDVGIMAVAAHCPQLQELDLIRCGQVSDAGVVAIVTRCRQLHSLDMRYCDGVTNAGLRAVLDHAPQLEYLYISYFDGIDYSWLGSIENNCQVAVFDGPMLVNASRV
eukprot:jgi/Mesvir1/13533/Mv16414-RA.1